jgi:hypothetical protein
VPRAITQHRFLTSSPGRPHPEVAKELADALRSAAARVENIPPSTVAVEFTYTADAIVADGPIGERLTELNLFIEWA